MYPGEYPQPLIRQTFVQVPVVSGYVAARLQAQYWFAPTLSGYMSTNLGVLYENVGNTWFSVQLQETDDRSISGVRYALPGSAAMVCPGGHAGVACSNLRPILEVLCTGTTTGQLRMQISSTRRWTEMGFDRLDPFYATSLWQAKEQPGPVA
jgi:hypothetical protein